MGSGFPGNLDRHGSKAPKDPIPMPLSKIFGDVLHEAHSARATKVSTEFFFRLDKFTSQVSPISSFDLVAKIRGAMHNRL